MKRIVVSFVLVFVTFSVTLAQHSSTNFNRNLVVIINEQCPGAPQFTKYFDPNLLHVDADSATILVARRVTINGKTHATAHENSQEVLGPIMNFMKENGCASRGLVEVSEGNKQYLFWGRIYEYHKS